MYPSAGTLRVHPAPDLLAPPDPYTPGPYRFDDPDGLVAVRYTATRLVGCLLETMARFRPDPVAEAVLALVAGVEEGDLDWEVEDTSAVGAWLERQQVGTFVVGSVAEFVDVEDPATLTELDKHPRVRAAIEVLDEGMRLDVALVRLGGRELGRPISQAVGAAVREWIPTAAGIAYRSRLATDEPCWAIWEHTRVSYSAVPLSPADPLHAEAVRLVAAVFAIPLPRIWRSPGNAALSVECHAIRAAGSGWATHLHPVQPDE